MNSPYKIDKIQVETILLLLGFFACFYDKRQSGGTPLAHYGVLIQMSFSLSTFPSIVWTNLLFELKAFADAFLCHFYMT